MKIPRAIAAALIAAPILLTAAYGVTGLASPVADQKPVLPPQHKKWLDEDVVYIITRTERDVFQKLQSDKERDLFIEAFWKQRDPTPSSPENEVKIEHYRRLSYANQHFGRQSSRAGWRTDQGRIYIILGEPNDIQRFSGKSEIVPCELWFYQDKSDIGLPPGFYVLFFQEHGFGEFRLYSPSTDGPMALQMGVGGDPTDYLSAYQGLKNKEPGLAEVSLSLIPGETSDLMGRPSLSSDILIQRIESTPQRQVAENYAEKFLKYKDIVEVEYTANYLDSESLVKVFSDPSGTPFIHFALEPRRLSVNEFDNKFYTTFQLNGSLTLPDGKIVYQYDRTIDLNIDAARMREVGGLPFDIQDLLPVVPGEYRLSVLVKNEVSKEFSSLEQTVRVPRPGTAPQLTSPLLGYKVAKLDAAQRGRLRAFQFGEDMVYCQPNRVFLPKDSLAVAFQVLGLDKKAPRNAEVRLTFLRDDQPFREKVRPVTARASVQNIIEEIPLADFPPSHYFLEVGLFVDGVEAAKAKEEFDVTHREGIARPWVHSRVLPGSDNPMFSHILGVELANLGRPDEALVYLEKARLQNKDNPDTIAALAQIYMTRGEFEKIGPLVGPLLSREKPPAYEILYLAGQAYQKTGQPDLAEAVFNRALTHYGVNASLLNALGDCYQQQGRSYDARGAWQKSLELSPDQPEVRRKIEALPKKN